MNKCPTRFLPKSLRFANDVKMPIFDRQTRYVMLEIGFMINYFENFFYRR